jgi:hypothetical protein
MTPTPTVTTPEAVASLTGEQVDLLGRLHHDVWTVARNPTLVAALTALWLERDPTPEETLRAMHRWETLAVELAGADELVTS